MSQSEVGVLLAPALQDELGMMQQYADELQEQIRILESFQATLTPIG